jgi:hypothetical protein
MSAEDFPRNKFVDPEPDAEWFLLMDLESGAIDGWYRWKLLAERALNRHTRNAVSSQCWILLQYAGGSEKIRLPERLFYKNVLPEEMRNRLSQRLKKND